MANNIWVGVCGDMARGCGARPAVARSRHGTSEPGRDAGSRVKRRGLQSIEDSGVAASWSRNAEAQYGVKDSWRAAGIRGITAR